MNLSQHLTNCGRWTGHDCTCWKYQDPDRAVTEDPKDAAIARLESDERISELVIGGQKKTIAALKEENRQLSAQVISVSDRYGYDHAHQAARIAEMDAENHDLREQVTKSGVRSREEEAYKDGYNVGVAYSDERVYRAETTADRLKTALVAIQSTTPGSAHRIAIQALTERIHCENVDEYTCAECSGHNRCEDEMDAGFGDYGRDDPREDR